MRIGIISEGRPDQAVIENILDGVFSDFELIPIRPSLQMDTTDVQLLNKAALGGISRIKTDCKEKVLLEGFFDQSVDNDFMIIQMDTAEIEEYNVSRPNKKGDSNYVAELRKNVIQKIKDWLDDVAYDEKLIYAISIEEMEAWLLTIYENRDSVSSMNPKTKLKRVLGKKGINSVETFDNYLDLSKPLKKKKTLKKYSKFNESLSLFIEELEKHTEEN